MDTDYIKIFDDMFYDIEIDEEMNAVIKESCNLLGSVIVKYGEILNEMTYMENRDIGLVDTVIILFVRKIMEHLDGINILVKKCSFVSANVILRTLLETAVSLRFILKEDTEKRAAAYYLFQHYKEIDRIKKYDEKTNDGKLYKEEVGEERFNEGREKSRVKRDFFYKVVIQSKKVFVEIEKTRQEKIGRNKNRTSWYEMCSEVKSFKGLMKNVGWEEFYDGLYGTMSQEVHSLNAALEMIPSENGLCLKMLRNPTKGFATIELASLITLGTLVDIYMYLEDGDAEKKEFTLYCEEYMQKVDELRKKFSEL